MGGLSYRDAGVDIDKKNRTLGSIGSRVRTTFTPQVLTEIGAFGGMHEARFPGYEDPILVSTNDGVGTKVRVATRADAVEGLGHDIVNHCINDILVQGAEPLFFFDYFASSHLDPAVFDRVIDGLVAACQAGGLALLGGETAEMPGVYADGEFDLVGFLVGVVERARVWPQQVAAGDELIGLRSDGLHTNGFSLVNRLIERDRLDLSVDPGALGESLGAALLRPHRSYLPAIRAVRDQIEIHALAHVTGGGIQDNLPRVLPEGIGAIVDRSAWTPNPVFRFLTDQAQMPADEAYHVFNMGCGMVVVVPAGTSAAAVSAFAEAGEEAWPIGSLVATGAEDVRVRFA